MPKEFNQIYFVWHPKDEALAKPYFDFVSKSLSRDMLRPMSRSVNIPIFYRTSSGRRVPKEIDLELGASVVFCFSSKWVSGSDEWRSYYDSFVSDNTIVVPVALDNNYSFKLNYPICDINFIREYEFSSDTKNLEFLVSAIQAIIKKVNFQIGKKGDDLTTKLFLSHAKHDDWATDIALSLKKIIDSTSLNNFFDATNIHASFNFSDEIRKGILDSTVVSIQSDSYSSRYWCQKEVQYAKEINVPIVVISSLRSGEDRIFPYSSNVPSINIGSHSSLSREDAYKILELALLETLKFYYNATRLKKYEDENTVIICRPPEPYDLKWLSYKDKKINNIVYPDPPLYEFESKLFDDFGLKVATPLTLLSKGLSNIQLGISISEPDNEELSHLGMSKDYLKYISQSVAKHTLYQGGTLVYGGDLRPSGYTEFIFDEALVVQDRLRRNDIKVRNYSAWPIYLLDDEEMCEWIATYNKVATFIKVPLSQELKKKIDEDEFLPPNDIDNKIVWSKTLSDMRQKMIGETDARICVGGRLRGYKGRCPGVLEEILMAIRGRQPVYLMGAFGGVVGRVCELLESNQVPEELTSSWQESQNEDFLEIAQNLGFDFDKEVNNLSQFGLYELSKSNGLSVEENIMLFHTLDIGVALDLIFKGVVEVYG
ncbi:hypothetical protein TW84_21385 [Vibrio neptunius]|uniref:TIR domain-containing protein n=1 Tax=Vibrio neptunius TaxID=170651 RepID=UPI0005FA044B|nr:TIR domain-containing protein [Vibrio neptunius]KJY85655.1 hypothetical protein TW84_21385 [Vibrio neptunius]